MIKIKDLEIGKEYLMVYTDSYIESIVRIRILEVIENEKCNISNILILNHVTDEGTDEFYLEDKNYTIYEHDDEFTIFELNEYEEAKEVLWSIMDSICFEELPEEKPEDYPDWDGDESLMYYVEHCNDVYFWEDDEE